MKYSPEQLQAMAQTLLQQKARLDYRYAAFVVEVSDRTGPPSPQVEQAIQNYADGNFNEPIGVNANA